MTSLTNNNDIYTTTSMDVCNDTIDTDNKNHDTSTIDKKYINGELALNALDALRKTLIWGHLCPTAPDTLSCHPFTDEDPFIIDKDHLPKIMFTGGQVS